MSHTYVGRYYPNRLQRRIIPSASLMSSRSFSSSVPTSTIGLALSSLLLVLLGLSRTAGAQTPIESSSIEPLDRQARVYLDCDRCDRSYLRRNLTFVNYVRDRKQADIHLMGTVQQTGGGGTLYRLEFIGQGPFQGLLFELTYEAAPTLTRDERRRGLADRIRLGLVPFVNRTPVRDRLSVSYDPPDEDATNAAPEDDPWNQWVFEISGSGRFDTEEQEESYDVRGEVEASRITRAWKLEFQAQSDYELDIFELNGEEVSSSSQDYDVDADVVKSLGPRWGAGVSGTAFSRTFTNTLFAVRVEPAVEHNLFPYRLSDQKELTITYQVGPEYRNYREETIFNQEREFLVEQSLRIALDLDQPWGGISSSLRGSHYVHDVTKNRVQFRNYLNLQIVEGLSLRLSFNAELIRDQLHLPAEDPDDEEVLLRRQSRATSYQMSGSIGLSYTFGSIYNNVVNTRL